MTRRPTRARAYAPDPDAPGRSCDIPGCCNAGEYRAPKDRSHLRDYWWFCLDHVRAYNAAWDFYKGMSPAQIEAQMRADTAWQRPTWPLGRLGAAAWEEALATDPLLSASGTAARPRGRPDGRSEHEMPTELREPLATLGLAWPTTLTAVKARYKELAKRHHPDANGGDRAAEERLKVINLAYAAVRQRLPPEPHLAATA